MNVKDMLCFHMRRISVEIDTVFMQILNQTAANQGIVVINGKIKSSLYRVMCMTEVSGTDCDLATTYQSIAKKSKKCYF